MRTVAPSCGAARRFQGKLFQSLKKGVKIRIVTQGDIRRRLGCNIIGDGGGIRIGRSGDDNQRH